MPLPLIPIATVLACLALVACSGGGDSPASDAAPRPALVITQPKPNGVSEAIDARTSKGGAELKGQLRNAPPESEVTVDGRLVPIDPSGSFAKRLELEPGGNIFRVEATIPGQAPLVEEINITRTLTDEQRAQRERESERKARKAREAVAQEEGKAEREFRAEAKRIDPKQLIKAPSRYIGEEVVYEGQIFQVREDELGETVILLSLTNEGYGFWTDEVYVTYAGSISSVEDDVITIYGTVEGETSYETVAGGERGLPQITAEYIDE